MSERSCKNCKHYVVSDTKINYEQNGCGTYTQYIYSCEKRMCEFKPKDKEVKMVRSGVATINNCGDAKGVEVARVCANELWHYGTYNDLKRAREVAKELGDNAIVLRLYNTKSTEQAKIDALIKANNQLKKQIEMLKLDRDCDKWIPTNEELPEKQDVYLVTWKSSLTNRLFLQMLEYDVEDGKWILEKYMESYKDVEIIAWQPVPEPYNGG